MSGEIVLSAGIRQNLLSLQNTSALQQTTQERLATGKKVNSALDNAVNYFTASSLSQRGNELSNLLDSMTNGINTLKTASNGLTSITTTIQSMQATVTQARQDASWQSASYAIDATAIGTTAVQSLTFSGGAVGATPVSISLTTTNKTSVATFPVALANNGKQFTISDGTRTTADITLATGDTADAIVTKINAATKASGTAITAANVGGQIQLSSDTGTATVAEGTTTGGAALLAFGAASFAVKTVDQILNTINTTASLTSKVKATNNAGQLQITNLSTVSLSMIGATSTSVNGGTGAANTQTTAGNLVRANLVAQFNQQKDQLDKTAADSSFNGINLLTGDVLKLFFNELSTSTLSIQSTNPNGINSSVLGLTSATNAEFQDNTQLDTRLQSLQAALASVSSQASDFGSNLSIVQNRQTFTNNMINTLQTGADGLTLADTNLEGANMLALQTRQQLSITALSLASQANQSVLKLFG